MKYLLFLLCTSLLLVSCGSMDCESINQFASHEAALEVVQNYEFLNIDLQETPESSWIKSATFYSCDNMKGFVIIQEKEGIELIFQGVPIETWNGFKTASSYGTYANQSILGKFKVTIQ